MSKPRKLHVRKARNGGGLPKSPMEAVVDGRDRTKAKSSRASGSRTDAPRGARLVARFIDDTGLVVVNDVADWFGMSKGQLAETVGIRPETLQRVSRVGAPKTQSRVKEMLEIIGRVADWAGGKDQAMAWYRAEPIPAFGGRTAEALVKDGKATALRDYLDHVALGGFA
jgi:hypothetical protein